MRRSVSVGVLAAVLLAAGRADAQDRRPGARVETPRRDGLRIDIGRFSAGGRGIVIEIGKRPWGGVHVDVQTHAPEGGRGIHVNVDPDAVHYGDGPVVDVQIVKPFVDAPAEAELPVPPVESDLGVSADPIPPALSEQLGERLPKGRGLLVTEVLPGSPAAQAGLRRHDVLTAYEGEVLSSPDDLQRLVAQDPPGTAVELTIVRGARAQTIEVILGQRTVEQQEAPLPFLGAPERGEVPQSSAAQPAGRPRELPVPPRPEAPNAASDADGLR